MRLDEIIHGDCIEGMRNLPDCSIDSVVTDPPYGISFMAKDWDSFAGNKAYAEWVQEWATECMRVLKPGGHLLAFSGTRTYHALAWGIESAGFEIRDMIEWLYLSGFPKSMDVGKQFDKQAGVEREVVGRSRWSDKGRTSNLPVTGIRDERNKRIGASDESYITIPTTPLAKQWDGWGTALKPAHEPIVMARKPLSSTVASNVEVHGTGAINIDGCRIQHSDVEAFDAYQAKCASVVGLESNRNGNAYGEWSGTRDDSTNELGRFPANCVTIEDDAWYSTHFNISPRELSQKASKEDRNADVNGNSIAIDSRVTTDGRNKAIDNPFNRGETMRQNHHPTVKPTNLMAWLIRLVTPPKGIVLDPFVGSGTTLVAAKREGFHYIGYEIDADYLEIAEQRVNGIGLFSGVGI